jgi:hypothetical protein
MLYFEDDYLEVELAIHIYVDKWPMTLAPTIEVSGYNSFNEKNLKQEKCKPIVGKLEMQVLHLFVMCL